MLGEKAIAEIHRLKEQFPRINATLIYHKLIEDGFINQSRVSVSSVQRFIKHNDLRAAVNPNQKDRKAFEEAYPGGMYQADTSYTTNQFLKVKLLSPGILSRCFPGWII